MCLRLEAFALELARVRIKGVDRPVDAFSERVARRVLDQRAQLRKCFLCVHANSTRLNSTRLGVSGFPFRERQHQLEACGAQVILLEDEILHGERRVFEPPFVRREDDAGALDLDFKAVGQRVLGA